MTIALMLIVLIGAIPMYAEILPLAGRLLRDGAPGETEYDRAIAEFSRRRRAEAATTPDAFRETSDRRRAGQPLAVPGAIHRRTG